MSLLLCALVLTIFLLPSAPASADLNCADFDTRGEAQDHLERRPSDPDRLDADNDGLACEWNPSGGLGVMGWGLVGIAILTGVYFLGRRSGESQPSTAASHSHDPSPSPPQAQSVRTGAALPTTTDQLHRPSPPRAQLVRTGFHVAPVESSATGLSFGTKYRDYEAVNDPDEARLRKIGISWGQCTCIRSPVQFLVHSCTDGRHLFRLICVDCEEVTWRETDE